MKTTKILFIDPDLLFRKGFALYLDAVDNFEVLGEASCVSDLKNDQLKKCDLILFDTAADSDYRLFARIQKKYPGIKMILLAAEPRLFENYLFASTHNVEAFLTKKTAPEMVVEAIRSVALKKQKGIVYPENTREQLFGETHERKAFFSSKELNVLGLLGKGKSNQEIAQILNNSKRTIETHRRRMIERIGCKNIIPVIMYALNKNYIRIETDELLMH